MICNDKCDCFVDGARPYCSISGLAVSEGMKCLEKPSGKKEKFIPLEKMTGATPSKSKKKK